VGIKGYLSMTFRGCFLAASSRGLVGGRVSRLRQIA
jgi:hypothetical protein